MIKIFIMDVDGTLTDGGIYIGEDGELVKCFDVKDGYGIKNILKEYGIKTAIITGRKSKIVENRCKELAIDDLIQECTDKKTACKQLLKKYKIDASEAAYIGDDLNDYEVMKYVGVCGCPLDAVNKIKEISNFISQQNGGHGAVRDFIEFVIRG